jgi:hypothetical protein
MKQYLLGIDVGTTGTKTLLFGTDGELLGHAYRPYATNIPQPLYSEQNPEDIGGSDRWREILVKTAEIFYKKQVFWFLPTLMHNLLKFFGGRSEQRLFSQGLILEIARSNLLLSISKNN